MTTNLDKSEHTGIVITCTECVHWFAFRFDILEAYSSAEDHDIRVHDIEPKVAQNRRHVYESRMRKRSGS